MNPSIVVHATSHSLNVGKNTGVYNKLIPVFIMTFIATNKCRDDGLVDDPCASLLDAVGLQTQTENSCMAYSKLVKYFSSSCIRAWMPIRIHKAFERNMF